MRKPKSGERPWSPAELHTMRQSLAAWYSTAQRDLPWRRTGDPYAITVSELMLQQTQVVTVIPYYQRWIKLFPNWELLAQASENAVLKAWEGLGYYRRARQLHALAHVVQASGGALPSRGGELLTLPGIGPYTAAAIASIAFGEPLAVLDGNVMRVLARLLAWQDDITLPSTRAKLQAAADVWLDPQAPGNHNQAVMELGATVCLPRKPQCLLCPLRNACRGRAIADILPVKSRIGLTRREETVAVVRNDGGIYCVQGKSDEPWHGLWRLPLFHPAEMRAGSSLGQLRYGITRYSVTMQAISAEWVNAEASTLDRPGSYLATPQIDSLPFAAPHRRMLNQIELGSVPKLICPCPNHRTDAVCVRSNNLA